MSFFKTSRGTNQGSLSYQICHWTLNIHPSIHLSDSNSSKFTYNVLISKYPSITRALMFNAFHIVQCTAPNISRAYHSEITYKTIILQKVFKKSTKKVAQLTIGSAVCADSSLFIINQQW